MAEVPIFSAPGAPQTARLPGVLPEAFGAGQFAHDVAAAGSTPLQDHMQTLDAQHQVQMIELEDARAFERSDRMAAYATSLGDLKTKVVQLRSNLAPGAAGHEQAVGQLVDQWTDNFMGSIHDPVVAADLKDNVALAASGIKTEEAEFAAGKRADKQVTDADTASTALANTVFTDPSDRSFTVAIAGVHKMVDGWTGVPDDKKAEYLRTKENQFTIARLEGTAVADPRAAIAAIDSGNLNTVLEGNQISVLRSRFEERASRLEAEARRAQMAGVETMKATARNAIDDVNKGGDVDLATLQNYRAQAAAINDVNLTHDLDVAIGSMAATKGLLGASPAELSATLHGIEAKPDWRKDPATVAAHARVQAMVQETTREAQNDQLGLWSRTGGGPVTPLNLADPASMAQRFASGDAAAKRFGALPQYLTEAEAAPLRQQFAKGGADDKLALISTLAAYGPQRGTAMLRQIAPAEPSYGVLIDLAGMRNRAAGQMLAHEALGGWDLIKADSKLLDTAKMQASLYSTYGDALAMMNGVKREGMIAVAKGIYATRRVRSGGGDRYDETAWLAAVRSALGEAGDGSGGIAKARDGSIVVLPRGASEGDLFGTIARASDRNFGDAAGKDFPMWGDQVVPVSQLRQLTPVMVADGLYTFRTRGGGYIRSKNHAGNFVFDIHELARQVFHGQ